MKKHIIGLAFFSFIVSAAAVIYAIFNIPQITPVYEIVSTPQYIPAERTHCKLRSRANRFSLEIKQAVYDVRTRQFNWELTASPSTSRIALHFFIRDANGTRYLNSIFAPQASFENGAIKAASSSRWLDRLESYENTYVIPEYTSGNEFDDKNYQPNFDAARAMPVTIYYGK